MKQLPHDIWNGITTRSPGLISVTSLPTSSTMPIGSWPSTSPSSMNGPMTSYRCRSEPQMPVEVIRTIASVGSRIEGSGTVSTRTSRFPCHVSARIRRGFPSHAAANGSWLIRVREPDRGRVVHRLHHRVDPGDRQDTVNRLAPLHEHHPASGLPAAADRLRDLTEPGRVHEAQRPIPVPPSSALRRDPAAQA